MSDEEFEVKSQNSDEEEFDNDSESNMEEDEIDSDDEEPKLDEMYLDDDNTEQTNDLDEGEDFYLYDYKQKFTSDLRKNYIEKIHPEEVHITFDEIVRLSIVQRDSTGRIVDSLHRTFPIL